MDCVVPKNSDFGFGWAWDVGFLMNFGSWIFGFGVGVWDLYIVGCWFFPLGSWILNGVIVLIMCMLDFQRFEV